MSRSLVFADSYDHYSDLSQKYASPGGGAGIDLTGTLSNTGIGCLILSQAFGPVCAVPPIRGTGTAYMVKTSYYQPGNEDSSSAGVICFIDVDPGGSGDITFLFRVGVNASFGLTCLSLNNTVLAISAPNLVVANSYNTIEAKCFFVASNGGSAIVRLNGQTVTWTTGGLTGITTLDPSRSSTGGECNNIRQGGPGSGANARQDDYSIWTSTSSADDDFPGPVRNYAMVPEANGAPLQWTPLSGTNFSEVNEIPPDGDTSYVSSSVVGNVDQYQYLPSLTPIPPGLIVYGAQVSLLSRVDSGSASLAASVGGNVSTGVGVGGTYHYTPIQPYDLNPVTGLPWEETDFPGTEIGPKQTA